MKLRRSTTAQRGISLVIVLLFLLVMSVLGVTAIRTSNLEEKMSGNERDRELAFEAAEATLRDAERDVFLNVSVGSPFSDPCVNGLCLPPAGGASIADIVNWDGGVPRVYGASSGAGVYPIALSRAPRYVVELLPDMPPCPLCSEDMRKPAPGGTPFRITATAWGRRASTQVQLQVVYVKRN